VRFIPTAPGDGVSNVTVRVEDKRLELVPIHDSRRAKTYSELEVIAQR
jgi:hypothetical protein